MLLVGLVLFMPYAALIPMPTIAAILPYVAYNICDEDSEINGPTFFDMTDRICGMPSLDSTCVNALENLPAYCREHGVSLIFSHAKEQPTP